MINRALDPAARIQFDPAKARNSSSRSRFASRNRCNVAPQYCRYVRLVTLLSHSHRTRTCRAREDIEERPALLRRERRESCAAASGVGRRRCRLTAARSSAGHNFYRTYSGSQMPRRRRKWKRPIDTRPRSEIMHNAKSISSDFHCARVHSPSLSSLLRVRSRIIDSPKTLALNPRRDHPADYYARNYAE